MAKRKWDKIDEEAEREGSAFKYQQKQICKFAWGKKISKQRNMHITAEKKIECKILKNILS